MGKSSAFTLAEIIITLTIVGVIAAMTIPDMVQDVQDNQYKTAWKKVYSELDQATRLMASDNGGTVKGIFSDDHQLKNQYVKYLRYIKQCEGGQTEGCWHNGNTRYLNGNIDTWNDYSALILSNGALILFRLTSSMSTCLSTDRGTPLGETTCGSIAIDTNGFGPPNTAGKDIFSVHILQYGLKPFGTQGDNYNGGCTKIDSGYACSAIYLRQ